VSDFTPGPWGVRTPLDRFNDGEQWDADEEWTPDYPRKVSVNGRSQVCAMSGVNSLTMSNAHLISAAPDMYEALKRAGALLAGGLLAGGFLVEQSPWFQLVGAIDAVLSKAEGKSL
jgi:hypothetical protein